MKLQTEGAKKGGKKGPFLNLKKSSMINGLKLKVDSMLKLSNCKATTQITHVFRTKVLMSMPLFGYTSYIE